MLLLLLLLLVVVVGGGGTVALVEGSKVGLDAELSVEKIGGGTGLAESISLLLGRAAFGDGSISLLEAALVDEGVTGELLFCHS